MRVWRSGCRRFKVMSMRDSHQSPSFSRLAAGPHLLIVTTGCGTLDVSEAEKWEKHFLSAWIGEKSMIV